MVDIRIQIKEGLKAICPNVKLAYPEGNVELPLITYAEITNVQMGKWHERVEMQVDVRAATFETCIDILQRVNAFMNSIGFNRTYVSPDTSAKEAEGLYHKAANYVGHINTNINNIFGGY